MNKVYRDKEVITTFRLLGDSDPSALLHCEAYLPQEISHCQYILIEFDDLNDWI